MPDKSNRVRVGFVTLSSQNVVREYWAGVLVIDNQFFHHEAIGFLEEL